MIQSASSPGQPANSLEHLALARLKANRRTGFDPYYRINYEYSIPSPGRYVWQWFWDSCFHVIALAKLDPGMAMREMETLLASQNDDGFIGHIVYWGRKGALVSAFAMQGKFGQWRRRHSAMIQPPLLGQALEAVWEATGDREFLNRNLPKVIAYYDWISRERDPDNTGLFSIISPFECGMDNSPVYDAPLGLKHPGRLALLWANRKLDLSNYLLGRFDLARIKRRNGFHAVDPLMNAVMAEGLRATARLLAESDHTERIPSITQQAQKMDDAINDRLWDDDLGYYIYLYGNERKRLTDLTAGSLMPLICQSSPKERVRRVVEEHLLNPSEFWATLPVPSVARNHPDYDPIGESSIWRGPACMNLNWFFVHGLRMHGHTETANEIATRSRESALKEFREFYSPETGAGMRGTQFGWATAVIDM
ncbi:MAG: trehalase family glycosidase [Chloroflexi bacterium]|nr:trehalase family glycosidase [Chloroflexota bacterium]